MAEPVGLKAPARILVRAPNWVGDVLMATPALRALRAAHPASEIAVAGRPLVAELLRGVASVDRFVPQPGRGVREQLAHAGRLRRERFDWAVLLPDSAGAALAPFLARIPVRCGYARDALRRALVTHALEVPTDRGKRVAISMIERYQRITRALGCADAGQHLDLALDPAARERVGARLGHAGVSAEQPLLIVTPGASFGASKLWPVEHFARACDRIQSELELRTVLAPGPGEEPVARRVADLMKVPAVVLDDPPTSLGELAALVERGRLLLTNDTGPRQMAVALGRPVVALLGPTDPGHTNHLLELQRVLREPVDCSPCHLKVCPIDHRCMTRLGPERVVAAAAELLS